MRPDPTVSTAVLIVDHGSRLAESNAVVEQVATRLAARNLLPGNIVEPAHMELAEPSIAMAYDRCVARGATQIIVLPFFLGPGRHWTQDIPHLARAAAARHPGTQFRLAAPLGDDDLMLDLLERRLWQTLDPDAGEGP